MLIEPLAKAVEGSLYRDVICRMLWLCCWPLSTFAFHGILGGIPLCIFRGFYMGPALLKTSPLLGAPFVRKRV